MPKKMTPAQVREWLADYDAGKSPTSIARAFKKDPRTVEAHIEAALRQRDLDHGKRQMLNEALRSHQSDLELVVDDLLKALEPAEISVESIDALDGYSLPVPLPWRSGNPPWRNVKLGFKEKRHWGLLKQHLPKDDLWGQAAKWEGDITALLEARDALWRKAIHEGEKRTRLKLAPDGPEPHLALGFPKAIANLVLGPLQGRRVEKLDRKSFEFDKDGLIWFKGDSTLRLARSPKEPERVVEGFLALLAESGSWPETKNLKSAYEALLASTSHLKRTAEDILFLHFIAGRCDICERLGGRV